MKPLDNDADVSIGACRPVELNPDDDFDAIVLAETFVYDNSVEGICDNLVCKARIWVGPKVKEAHDRGELDILLCFRCAAVSAYAADGYNVTSLDNPQPNPHKDER